MEPVNNFSVWQDLRSRFSVFTYESHRWSYHNNDVVIEYCFKLGDKYQFNPRSVISFNTIPLKHNVASEEIEQLVFHIGLIELISYWKAACSERVVVKAGGLSKEQIQWWKGLYFKGLGEFFYLNNIRTDVESFMNMECEAKDRNSDVFSFQEVDNKAVLVPIGGGKDSPVTLKLHQEHQYRVVPLIINPRGATIDTVTAAGLSMQEAITIERTIDPELLALNRAGFLNGHTPFSAMLAFYALLVARLAGISDIALSNEASANESTVSGSDVNHQYSKSFEFEQGFRQYYSRYLSKDFNYFSFLRPLSELQISYLFSSMREFHAVFRSCNAGSHQNVWCCKCPKCLFASIILSPFISPDERFSIFGEDLLNTISLSKALEELCGLTPVKPFECVGTTSEVNLALHLSLKQYEVAGETLPLLLQYWSEKSISQLQYDSDEWRQEWNHEHFLDDERQKIIRACLKK